MKKKITLLMLFALICFGGWAQSISITSIPGSTQVGNNLVVNYKYTASAAGRVTIVVTKNGGTNPWDLISTVGYVELNPAVAGTNVAGTFTVPIPSGTAPTSALTGNQNYRVTLELFNSSGGWLAGDYSTVGYNFTAAAVTPAISVTSIPGSTQVGNDLVVNYKYTAAAAGKVTIGVTKNGGTNPWDLISTVGFVILDPAVAGTDVTGTFTVPIPSGTTPTSALTGNQNYRVTIELLNSSGGWLAGDYSTVGYNFTAAAVTPAISITSIPSSTQAGTNLVVNYKYTAAAATGKTSIAVTKNGGVNPWDFINTVGYVELNPAAAGTDVAGTFTVPIPVETMAAAALTGNENYRVTLELKNSSGTFLAGDYSTVGYSITPAATWTGTVSTDWATASNWNIGVPNSMSGVLIASGAPNQPAISTNVTINSLSIVAGATLNVNEGNVLTVSNAISNSGDLILKSGASGTGSLLSSSAAANVTQQHYLTSNQRGWRLISNPLSSTTFGTLAAGSTTPIALGANASGAYNAAANTWSSGTDADTMALNTAYKVFVRGRASEVTGLTYSVVSPANVTLAIKGAAENAVPAEITTTSTKFYLVANPFTAPVSLRSIIGASTGLSNTVSYYNPTNGSSGSEADKKSKKGGYTTKTIVAGAAGDATDVVIPAMGAIFVQASAAGAINVPKSAIFTGTNLSGTYNHRLAQLEKASGLKLEVTSGGTYYDAIALQFKAAGEDSSNIDFGKLKNEELDFYSISAGNKMAVSELELKDQVIPLGISSTSSKSYSIKVAENSIPADYEADLIDNLLSTTTALKAGATYDFTIDNTSTSQGNSRFAINLKVARTLSVQKNDLDSTITVYPNPSKGQFIVSNAQEGTSTIEITNIMGKVIHVQKLNSGNNSVQTNKWATGVYILKASNNGTDTTKKLIIQ